MDQTPLGRRLKKHFLEEGRFSPFAYSIGLESSVRESAAAAQDYPIPEPVSDETLAQFLRSLTFFHEAIHLCQYIGTSFGLRTLRFTNILLSQLSKGRHWKLPIAQSLFDRLEELSPEERKCYEACLLFLDAMDQVRLHHGTRASAPGDVESAITVEYLPWSPHFFMIADKNPEASEKYAEALRSAGVHVRRLPRLRSVHPKGAYQIVLNAATLMEAYAIIGELNHIQNALKLPLGDAIALLPPGNEYHVLLSYMLQDGLCDGTVLMPTLAVCIDVALMYDPFVLFNVPWDVADAQGRHDQYPGETFLLVCAALRKTEPLTGNSREEIDKFCRALCANAGLPDPQWMATKAYEVAAGLLAKSPGKDPLLGNVLKAHCDALKYRCEHGPTYFPLTLVTTDTLMDVLELALPATSYYNLRTRRPDRFDPAKVDGITVHSILLQAVGGSRIDCPLKKGVPFFCDSAAKASDKLCMWKNIDTGVMYECWVDILEQRFGFQE